MALGGVLEALGAVPEASGELAIGHLLSMSFENIEKHFVFNNVQ